MILESVPKIRTEVRDYRMHLGDIEAIQLAIQQRVVHGFVLDECVPVDDGAWSGSGITFEPCSGEPYPAFMHPPG